MNNISKYMPEYKLEAKVRIAKGEKVRNDVNLPGVVYGARQDNISLVINYRDFVKLYDLVGGSSLIDLVVDGKDFGKILIHDLQYDPITNHINHVDLKRIEMGKEMEATVELEFVGEAPAVKEMGGTLVKNLVEVDVRCLPKDLPSELIVDLSVLKTFDDSVRIKDLVLPEGVVITSPSANDVVAKAIPALTEEELKAMDEAGADVSKVEVAGKKPEEGEVTATTDGEKKPEEKKEEKK